MEKGRTGQFPPRKVKKSRSSGVQRTISVESFTKSFPQHKLHKRHSPAACPLGSEFSNLWRVVKVWQHRADKAGKVEKLHLL